MYKSMLSYVRNTNINVSNFSMLDFLKKSKMAAKIAEKRINWHTSAYTRAKIQIVGSKSMLSYVRSKNINVSNWSMLAFLKKYKMAAKNGGKTYKSA